MIYTDAEVRRWWDGMTTEDQGALFARILERSEAQGLRDAVYSARYDWMEHDMAPPANTLHQMRKWDR